MPSISWMIADALGRVALAVVGAEQLVARAHP